MKQDKKENQKPISANQLIEAAKATQMKKGEAIISVIKKANDDVHLKWAGTSEDLLNSAYTLLQNDVKIAAIICRATKDYVDSLKADPNAWMRLTHEVAKYDGIATDRQSNIIVDGKEEAS